MKFIIIASPIIVKENKILLIRRVKEPSKSYWQLPGGKVKMGEDKSGKIKLEEPIDTVKREVKEETGLDFKNPVFVNSYEHYYPELDEQYFFMAFKGKVDSDTEESIEEINKRIKLNRKEASEFRWFSKKELAKIKMMKGAEMISKDNM